MCRKNLLHGCSLMAFGFGLLLGHWLESWLLCAAGGLGLVVLGLWLVKRR